MTLIIGAKCKGGVILAADRKVVRGEESDIGDKIFEQGGLALAFEGLTGIRDDFLLLLESELEANRGLNTLYEAKLVIEDIVASLSNRYAERLGEDAGVGAVLAGLSEISSGKAELYNIHPEGYGETVQYRCAGHGAEYAHSIAKFLLSPSQPIDECAYWAAFVVAWVSDNVDLTVGGEPQVAMVRDHSRSVQYLSDSTVAEAISQAESAQGNLAELFKGARSS